MVISRASPAAATDSGFSGEGDVGIPEIDIQMRSIPIVAKTRKLKAVWTPELLKTLMLITQLMQKLN